MRVLRVIGIGVGDPAHLTVQAVTALNETQVFFVVDKGATKRELADLRRRICARYIERPGYRFVELAEPARADGGDYRRAVADWHAARAAIWAEAIATELGPHDVGAFLAWGDPALYDSTLRILDAVATRVELRYEVIPGITAVQALTAAHRIPLNEVGEPVLITTGRQLRTHGLTGTAVVMLDGDCSFTHCPPRTRIWWGAYLGSADQLLIAGTVGEVGEQIRAVRAQARARHGWLMDTYLLRPAAACDVA
ncbi:precorrin-6A synthase (deacetylating) [Mycolicibacillus trivialis]